MGLLGPVPCVTSAHSYRWDLPSPKKLHAWTLFFHSSSWEDPYSDTTLPHPSLEVLVPTVGTSIPRWKIPPRLPDTTDMMPPEADYLPVSGGRDGGWGELHESYSELLECLKPRKTQQLGTGAITLIVPLHDSLVASKY